MDKEAIRAVLAYTRDACTKQVCDIKKQIEEHKLLDGIVDEQNRGLLGHTPKSQLTGLFKEDTYRRNAYAIAYNKLETMTWPELRQEMVTTLLSDLTTPPIHPPPRHDAIRYDSFAQASVIQTIDRLVEGGDQ